LFTWNHQTGRLVEIRLRPPVSDEEVDQILKAQKEGAGTMAEGFVAVVDLRQAHVFPGHVADHFIALLRRTEAGLERSAMLVSTSAVFSMQVERGLHEAGNEHRRAFRSSEEMQEWLGEVLTVPEKIRLRQFLAEDGP
jgi:hypothetical protein